MKKVAYILLLCLMCLIALMLVRTFLFSPADHYLEEKVDLTVDSKRLADNLATAIRHKTISSRVAEEVNYAEYEKFISWLADTYPNVHQTLTMERVNNYTLLYKWEGSEKDLEPVLFSAHYDVVPVNPLTADLWEHPPFAGVVGDTYVWGRGALDNKSTIVALIEAAEWHVKNNFKPKRTLYFAFTHDEEIGGVQGSAAIVDKFKNENITLDWTLDEGSFVLKGFFPGVAAPIASINIAEKGYLTIELKTRAEGGHSSMPPKETAIDILAKALVQLKSSPMPASVTGESYDMFDALAGHMPFSKRFIFANRWIFSGLIDKVLSNNNGTNAMIRTTTATTVFNSGIRENVLPKVASAAVNFRIHPTDTVDGIVSRVEELIDDPRVEIEIKQGVPASAISDVDSLGFSMIAKAVRQVFGDVIVAPGLTIGGTDSRWYSTISRNSYRFNPALLEPPDASTIHGVNEKLSIDNVVNTTVFFNTVIEMAGNNQL